MKLSEVKVGDVYHYWQNVNNGSFEAIVKVLSKTKNPSNLFWAEPIIVIQNSPNWNCHDAVSLYPESIIKKISRQENPEYWL